ncbi:hypothetical protein VTL71DRAFT_2724 [Oculimacula yallundae]|uniref:ribonuclease H n=1 Tax=Oculimacula yallundae TaxID=86028 RepID=A0ABR4C9M4_9HELO
MKTEYSESDIGQELRMLARPARKHQRKPPRGSLAARVGGRGRITRRSAIPKRARVPTGPRNSSTTRTLSSGGQSSISRSSPEPDRWFNTDVHGSHTVEDVYAGLRRLEDDPNSIIVAVHGTSIPVNRTPQAGYGVFISDFARQLNRSGRVPTFVEQTADFAETFAAIQALEVIYTLAFTGQNISHVVIKTNSKFLVTSMTDLVWTWAERGFKNSRGQPLANGGPLSALHDKALLLEKKYGIKVSFCQVSWEYNEVAATLAQEGARKRA